MSVKTISPPDNWHRFSQDELYDFLKKYKLFNNRNQTPKELIYIDPITDESAPCTVVGMVDKWTTVIDVNGNLDCIYPDFLVDMQSVSRFSSNKTSEISNIKGRYCVIDVETPNGSNDSICAIGVILINDGRIENRFYSLVNPEAPFSCRNIAVHSITPKDVLSAPTFPEIYKTLSCWFEGSIIVAHNATFDLNVLCKAMENYCIPVPKIKYLCTMQISKHLYPNEENYKLPTLCSKFGIDLDHHNAESDCNACAKLLLLYLNSSSVTEELCEFNYSQSNCDKKISKSFHYSDTTLALHELEDLLQSITEDNILTLDEISQLSEWVDKHQELNGNYPFDKIHNALIKVLADGVVDSDEKKYLLNLFKTVFDPIAHNCCTQSSINVSGKLICLSGDFDSMPKAEAEKELSDLGAIIKKNVVKDLDYLIVGEKGSSSWSSGNYGSKVKKALENQQKGLPVQIIREADFLQLLKITEVTNV